MTRRPPTRPSSVVTASVMPSAKYSSPPPIVLNGSTARDGIASGARRRQDPAVHTAPSSNNPPPAITAAATLAIAAIEVVLERCHRAAQLAHDTVGVPSCAGRAVDPGAGSVDTGGGASFTRILSTGAMNR